MKTNCQFIGTPCIKVVVSRVPFSENILCRRTYPSLDNNALLWITAEGNYQNRWINEWKHEWMKKFMSEWMNGCVNEWTQRISKISKACCDTPRALVCLYSYHHNNRRSLAFHNLVLCESAWFQKLQSQLGIEHRSSTTSVQYLDVAKKNACEVARLDISWQELVKRRREWHLSYEVSWARGL